MCGVINPENYKWNQFLSHKIWCSHNATSQPKSTVELGYMYMCPRGLTGPPAVTFTKYLKLKREFYFDVYTIISNRIQFSLWTICAFRAPNPRQWPLAEQNSIKSWKWCQERYLAQLYDEEYQKHRHKYLRLHKQSFSALRAPTLPLITTAVQSVYKLQRHQRSTIIWRDHKEKREEIWRSSMADTQNGRQYIGWVELIACLTAHLTIFQLYMWQHID